MVCAIYINQDYVWSTHTSAEFRLIPEASLRHVLGYCSTRIVHHRQGRCYSACDYQQLGYWQERWRNSSNPAGLKSNFGLRIQVLSVLDWTVDHFTCTLWETNLFSLSGCTIRAGEPRWGMPCRLEARWKDNEARLKAEQGVLCRHLK